VLYTYIRLIRMQVACSGERSRDLHLHILFDEFKSGDENM
jgi:hypothetical protein